MMKKFLPVIIIVLLSIVVSYSYFSPLLSGKRLMEHDRLTAYGAQQESKDYYNKTKVATNWSNSMFGGMPNVTFWGKYKINISQTLRKIEKLNIYPASSLIILILGSFLCLILLGINPWISILGALSYSFASHYFILIGAGHITKVWALVYLAPLIASIYLTFNRNKLLGAILTMIFLSIEISAVHPQISYYGGLAVLLLGLVYFIYALKNKSLKDFFIRVAYLIIPLIVAVGVNARYLLTTTEYSKYSTRGESILNNKTSAGEGLDKDYILDYSYDLGEAFSAFIPRIRGGGMGEPLTEKSATYELVAKSQGKTQARKLIKSIPLYWGNQPIVSGPFYFGAINIFLFVLGLFLIKGRDKWWLVSVVIMSFLLSLGAQFSFFNHLAIDYLPLYNKFRDVKNIVFIQHIAIWILGIMALNQIVQKKISPKEIFNGLKFATIIAGGFALIFIIFPSIAGDFSGGRDERLGELFAGVLKIDRKSALQADALRSLIFVLLSAGLILGYMKNKLKPSLVMLIASVLILADLWAIDKKYLNNDNFVKKAQIDNPFVPTKADLQILKDKHPNYRVFNMSLNPWSDASTSYFHKSIGGYSGAKLRRYQDMIEYHFSGEMQKIGSSLQTAKSQADVDAIFTGLNALNMLNTKYIIYNPDAAPLLNKSALGNVWFVNNVNWVENANDEIDAISKVNVSNTAIVNKEYEALIPQIETDSTAKINLESYTPNLLSYKSTSSSSQLAVFSEVFYPKGWIAKIDGVETDYLRANYILRAIVVPAGNHEITFEYKPKSIEIGDNITMASSALMLLLIMAGLYYENKKRKSIASDEE